LTFADRDIRTYWETITAGTALVLPRSNATE